MPTISNTIRLRDKMSATVDRIKKKMGQMTSAAQTAGKNIGDAMSRGTQRAHHEADRAFQGMQQGANRTILSFNNLAGAAVALAAAIGGIAAVQAVTDTADAYANMDARLTAVLANGQTLAELQDNIYNSAERARGSYLGMADSVAKLSSQAKKTFATNNEALSFVETFQKLAAVSGTSAQDAASAMFQMTQALSGGVLQGEELSPISDAMSELPQYIERYMRAQKLMSPTDTLKEFASEGKITADIVRNAMTDAAAEIDKRFKDMPTTFAQAFQIAKDKALRVLQPFFKDMIEWLNAGGAQLFADILTNVAYAALWAAQSVQWLNENIAPFGERLVFVIGTLIGYNLALWASAAASWVASGGVYVLINAIRSLSISLIVTTGGLWLIALAIGFLILSAYQWVQSVGGIRNAWAITIDAILSWWDDMKINFVELTGFILNLMDQLAAGVATYFENMVNRAIDNLNRLIGLANKIPGVEIAAVGNLNFADDIADKAKADIESRAAYVAALRADAEATKNQRKLVRESAAAERAKKEQEKQPPGTPNFPNMGGGGGPSGAPNDPINTTSRGGEVSISEEDLKYMRDLARVQFINKITTLRPSVNATFGDVRETADVHKIIGAIAGIVEESTAAALS
jgi:tape measure domain-containing protein